MRTRSRLQAAFTPNDHNDDDDYDDDGAVGPITPHMSSFSCGVVYMVIIRNALYVDAFFFEHAPPPYIV